MTELFRNNIAKYYFYKYDRIGTTIPKIKDVSFSENGHEVVIITIEENPRYMKGIESMKISKESCMYIFPAEVMGLMPISKRVSFN